MMKRKRMIGLVLILLLLFGTLPASATEAPVTSGSVGKSAAWSFQDGTLTISGSGELPDFSFLSLAPWNHLKDSITAVEIGDGITSIGDQAFSQYYSLQRVKIGTSVKSIGTQAFMLCTALQEVYIPSSVTVIENSAFDNCESMTSLTLENGVVSIGNSAFSDNFALKSVTIPDSVTTLGSYAFNNCTALESVVLGDGLTGLGSYAFYGCKALKTAEFGENLNSIGEYAFWDCYSLTNIVLPDTLDTIGSWAFHNCVSMTELTIPASVSLVGEYAFNGCTGISSLTIENGVASIDVGVFKGCTSITKVVIPDSVTFLGYQAFSGCTSLKTATLVSGLTAINKYTFNGCTALETVKMGDNVTTLGYEAFNGCTSLKSINLSEKLVTIDERVFWNCAALERISFPESLKTIGNYAFSDCNGLTRLTIPGTVESVGNFAFTGCTNLETVDIEEGVLSIGNGAFQNCSKLGMDLDPDSALSLNYVTIPDSVTYLGSQAFSGCTLLEDVSLGEGITEIGYHTFNNCTSLDSVLLPDSVITVGNSVFTNCENLRFVCFGKNVKTIGSYLFTGCDLVNSLWFRGDAPEIDEKAFLSIEAEATYYAGNTTWTEEKKLDYGGTITWLANWSESFLEDLPRDELNERYIRVTAYAREGEDGIGKKLSGVTFQSSAEPEELFGYTTIARNEASQYGIILRNEDYQDYVIPASVAASFQGTDGKAFEFTALMKKLPVFGKNNPYISTIFGRNHGTGEAYVELRSNRLVLSPSITQDVIITVRGFQAQDVLYTIGIPGKNIRQLSSRNGVFSGELLYNLAIDTNTLYVWAESGSTGEKTDPIPIYVNKAATNTDLEKQLRSGEISLFGEDGLKIKLGGNSSLFGEMEFDAEDFEIPVGLYVSGNTLKVSLGIDLFDNSDTKENADSKWNILKSFVDGWKTRRKKANEAVEAFNQWSAEMKDLAQRSGKLNYIPWQTSESKDFDFKIGAMGYAEYHYNNGQWVLVDGALGVDGEFKLGHEVQAFVGAPPIWPVYGAIQGGAEIEVTGHAIRGVPDGYSPLRFDLKLDITPELSVHAGLGLKDAASGGLYGAGYLPINMEFSNRHLTIAAKGEIGAEAEILGLVHKTVLLESDEIMLVDRYLGVSARAVAMDMGTEQTVTTVMSREYAQNTSEWLGSPDIHAASTLATDSAAAKGVTFQNLQTSIFSNSQPQLVTVGDRMLLVWSEDYAERDVYNRMRMVYSIYEPAGDSWSEPAPVWDNGCSDGYARLVSDGQNVWLLWQKAKTVLTEKNAADFAYIHANMELCLARFDPASGTFVDQQMITDNSTYEYAHHIYLDNGIPCVLWASAPDNALNEAGKHSITGWRSGNAEILVDSLNYILSIDAVGSEITYVSDTDGNLTTTGDITAFTMSESGTTAYDNSSTGSAVTYAAYASLAGEQSLFVSDMYNVYYLLDGQWMTVFSEDRVMGGNIQIVETSLGTTILWTESKEGGNALYSVQFRNGGWSEPVQISEGGQILSRISAVCYDGKLTGVCNANDLSYDSSTGAYATGETNLKFFQANEFTDIALNYSLPVDESGLVQNTDAALSVSVTNLGTTDAGVITFTVSDTLGTEVTQSVSCNLPSGESQIVTLTYPVPENYASTTITITAQTGETDADPADNVLTIEMGKPDLAITASSLEILDDAYLIKAVVENKSLVDAENVMLEFRMDDADSAPFLIEEVDVIGRENYVVIDIIIPDKAFYFDRNGLAYVYMTLNTNGNDSPEDGNTILILVEEPIIETELAAGLLGDLNLDGTVNSDDLTLLARHVGGIELVEGEALAICDVNGDGVVNADDLTLHARYVGGIITDWDQE